MPDALVFANENISSFQLEEYLKNKAFRVKLSFDGETVKQWLKIRSFDLMLMANEISFEKQQNLAELLWEQNPQAAFVLFNLDPAAHFDKTKIRMFGAQLVYGEKAFSYLDRIVKNVTNSKTPPKKDYKILVVEDLDAPRDIICSYIESLGYPSATGVSSAKQAIRLLKANPAAFDCIITDERMPEVSGHELVSFARSNIDLENLPIVILTANGTPDCLEKCLRAGASGFLVKPPKKQHLVRELARAMRVTSGLEKARMADEEDVDRLIDLIQSR